MTKKFISVILALLSIVSSFSVLSVGVSAAADVRFSYNPALALSYAERNWNNGVGLCSDFASKCIQAGGINVYKPKCTDLYRELNGTYGTSYKLTLTRGNKGSIKMSDNEGKLVKGDLVFYFCNACRSFEHVVICNGANIWGYAQDYAHNKAHNGKKQTYTYYHCGQDNWTLYSIHFDEGEKLYGERTNVVAPKINFLKNGGNGIVIKWNAISGADSYRAYRKTTDGSWEYVGQTSKPSITDKNAKNATKYYYTVRAVDNNVLSQYYGGEEIYSIGAPKPSIYNREGVKIKWETVSGADGYIIYRKNAENQYVRIGKIKGGSKNAFVDTDVTSGVKYSYIVKAYDGSQKGAYVKKGVSIVYLENPSYISASNVANGVQISFSSVAGAERYRVYRKAKGEKNFTALNYTTSTSFLDTTCVNGTDYIYSVKAIYKKTGSYYKTKTVEHRCVR